jgi:hypothetical protein
VVAGILGEGLGEGEVGIEGAAGQVEAVVELARVGHPFIYQDQAGRVAVEEHAQRIAEERRLDADALRRARWHSQLGDCRHELSALTQARQEYLRALELLGRRMISGATRLPVSRRARRPASQSSQLMGSFIGVIFNVMLPDMIIQVILALLLFFLTFHAGTKAMEIYRKENKALEEKKKLEHNSIPR